MGFICSHIIYPEVRKSGGRAGSSEKTRNNYNKEETNTKTLKKKKKKTEILFSLSLSLSRLSLTRNDRHFLTPSKILFQLWNNSSFAGAKKPIIFVTFFQETTFLLLNEGCSVYFNLAAYSVILMREKVLNYTENGVSFFWRSWSLSVMLPSLTGTRGRRMKRCCTFEFRKCTEVY